MGGGQILTSGIVDDNIFIKTVGGVTTTRNKEFAEITGSDIGTQRTYEIVILNNESNINKTLYPMICAAEDWAKSHDYQPYAMSNATITPALKECVDNGAKNLLNFSGSTPIVPPNCTMTDNGDGTYTITKTSANLDIPHISAQIKAGTYIFSGCPAGGSDSTYRLDIRTATNSVIGSDYGNGVKVTIPSDGWYRITCRLNSTYTTTGLTIKPMLCDPALWAISPTFEPHVLSNAELTAKERINESNISFLTTNGGGKNYFNPQAVTFDIYGANLTYSLSGDTITLSVTTSSDIATLHIKGINLPLNKDLVITGCPANTGYDIQVDAFNNGVYISEAADTGSGSEAIQFTTMTNSYLRIRIGANTSFTDLQFKIMVRDSNTDSTYQPYALSNAELTAKELVNEKNISSIYTQNGQSYNILDLNDVASISSSTTYSFDNATGSVIASCTTATYKRIIWNLPITIGIRYRIDFDVTSYNSAMMLYPTKTIAATSAPYGQVNITAAGHYSLEFTPDVDTLYVCLYLVTEPTNSNSITIRNFKIIPKSAYDAGFNEFVPYALSNAELTNSILLSLIMPFATNNYNVSNLGVKANATIDTSTGIITQTETDTQTNLRFQMSAFNGNTLVRYLTDNIIMTNNGVYYLTFTKSSDYNTLVFGHNGSAADFKVALPVSALSNGDYIFKINILNCIQGNEAYSFNDIAIVKKTGAYII